MKKIKKNAQVEGYPILAFDLDFLSSLEILKPCNQLKKLKIKMCNENLAWQPIYIPILLRVRDLKLDSWTGVKNENVK
jgi:hypothetical protein